MLSDLEPEHVETTAKNLQQAGNLAAAGLAFSIAKGFNPWVFALGVSLWLNFYWWSFLSFKIAKRKKQFKKRSTSGGRSSRSSSR